MSATEFTGKTMLWSEDGRMHISFASSTLPPGVRLTAKMESYAGKALAAEMLREQIRAAIPLVLTHALGVFPIGEVDSGIWLSPLDSGVLVHFGMAGDAPTASIEQRSDVLYVDSSRVPHQRMYDLDTIAGRLRQQIPAWRGMKVEGSSPLTAELLRFRAHWDAFVHRGDCVSIEEADPKKGDDRWVGIHLSPPGGDGIIVLRPHLEPSARLVRQAIHAAHEIKLYKTHASILLEWPEDRMSEAEDLDILVMSSSWWQQERFELKNPLRCWSMSAQMSTGSGQVALSNFCIYDSSGERNVQPSDVQWCLAQVRAAVAASGSDLEVMDASGMEDADDEDNIEQVGRLLGLNISADQLRERLISAGLLS